MLEHCITEWGKPDQQKEASSGPRADAIKVTVYYESFCPASMEFINSQWYPTYKKLNGTGILLSELVPFGNAKVPVTFHLVVIYNVGFSSSIRIFFILFSDSFGEHEKFKVRVIRETSP